MDRDIPHHILGIPEDPYFPPPIDTVDVVTFIRKAWDAQKSPGKTENDACLALARMVRSVSGYLADLDVDMRAAFTRLVRTATTDEHRDGVLALIASALASRRLPWTPPPQDSPGIPQRR